MRTRTSEFVTPFGGQPPSLAALLALPPCVGGATLQRPASYIDQQGRRAAGRCCRTQVGTRSGWSLESLPVEKLGVVGAQIASCSKFFLIDSVV